MAIPVATLQWNIQTLQAQLGAIEAGVSGNPNDPCSGMGPASAVPSLEAISNAACQIAHQAALTATGYAFACDSANGSDVAADDAENATIDACDIRYSAPPYGAAYGTMSLSGSGGGAVCLDPYYLKAVAAQVAAAATAVNAAARAQTACAAAGKTSANRLPPVVALHRPNFFGDDTPAAPQSQAAAVASGVAGGATVGAIVGVLVGLIADAPIGGALVGAIVGGVTGGIANKDAAGT